MGALPQLPADTGVPPARPPQWLRLVTSGDASVQADDEPDALAERVIRQVLRASRAGGLPPFAATLGLSPAAFANVNAVLGLNAGEWAPVPLVPAPDAPPFPYARLLAFVWRQRRRSDMLVWATAAAITCATFGRHHLWQDLGLTGRDDVNRLLGHFFPELIRLNHRDLKWKRFLYGAVGELTGQPDLRPPRCDGCDQFTACFGR